MHRFFTRSITPKLERLLEEKQIIAITGMRQVGKTTQLKYLYDKVSSPNKIWLNLEDVLVRRIFDQDSYQDIVRSLEREGLHFDQKAYLFIDEIQFIKNLPSVIKYFYDDYDVKFVVTGSSSFYLKNLFTESLAGRKIVQELHPLTFKEFLTFKGVKKTFYPEFKDKVREKGKLDQEKYQRLYREYVDFGGFPAVVLSNKTELKKEILRDILNSYFQIDITTLADFSDMGVLRDMLILLTQRIGQKLNITNLSNVLGVSRIKVYEYLELLQATYVIKLISQKSSVDNQISANNKLYFSDIGLATFLADVSLGSRLENSVMMNLVYEENVTYFQTKTGGEIDFVLSGKEGLEVKQNPSKQDLANLKKRAQSAGIKDYYLVGLQMNLIDRLVMVWDL